MAVTVGEVQAILSARDAMTSVLENARTAGVIPLSTSLQQLTVDARGFSQSTGGIWLPEGTENLQKGTKQTTELGQELIKTTQHAGKADSTFSSLASTVSAYVSAGAIIGFVKNLTDAAAKSVDLSETLRVNTAELNALPFSGGDI